jgi:hypothetical protein
VVKTCLLACLAWLVVASADAASGATFFRLFLTDGSALVSFGEFARLDDRVIFSMPVGGPLEQPRLYVVTLPANQIDWTRTDRYSMAVRAQWYAETRGEEEFQQLSTDVARVLNEVALMPDRQRGLEIAENARKALADWPRTHYGYRQDEVREIVALLDESISDLRASLGITSFDVDLVASTAEEAALEPVLGAPGPAEQLSQVLRVASMTERAADRVGLLHAALALINEAGPTISDADARRWTRETQAKLREEAALDTAYADMARRLMDTATKAASSANIAGVEKALDTLPAQDARLGRARPETVEALRASLRQKLEDARELRLRRDQWLIRRDLYREYERSAGSQLRQLVKLQPSLEAIRRLEGPSPNALRSLKSRLAGGADRLQRIGLGVPSDLKSAHEVLVSAWRFAEKAANARADAVASGNLATAWEASSAAAGALMMLNRAQQDISALIQLPQLQ